MNKVIFGIKHKPTSTIVFNYRTLQGNVKKAFFRSRAEAEKAVGRYFGEYNDMSLSELEVVEIGKRYEK